MPGVSAPLFVLWDIDHTLVDTGGLGRDAYASAFHAATGATISENWRFDGRTEVAAAIEALSTHGLPTDADLVQRLLDEIVAVHRRLAPEFAVRSRALPGVREAIDALSELSDVHQSVLTGNLRAVAELKLKAVDLLSALDMEIGAYGSDAIERTALAPFAFARVRDLRGAEFSGPETVIVGDTPRDVDAAAAVGATCIGVATGYHSTEQLRAAGARFVFPDLADTTAFIAALNSAVSR
jgi:phosphoglycolate phosphatase-like HAD superfamily hydrolase